MGQPRPARPSGERAEPPGCRRLRAWLLPSRRTGMLRKDTPRPRDDPAGISNIDPVARVAARPVRFLLTHPPGERPFDDPYREAPPPPRAYSAEVAGDVLPNAVVPRRRDSSHVGDRLELRFHGPLPGLCLVPRQLGGLLGHEIQQAEQWGNTAMTIRTAERSTSVRDITSHEKTAAVSLTDYGSCCVSLDMMPIHAGAARPRRW